MASQISIPGPLLGIGRQGPAISAGASGLRSNMSWCGGPPTRYTKMIDLAELLAFGPAPALRDPVKALAYAREGGADGAPPRHVLGVCLYENGGFEEPPARSWTGSSPRRSSLRPTPGSAGPPVPGGLACEGLGRPGTRARAEIRAGAGRGDRTLPELPGPQSAVAPPRASWAIRHRVRSSDADNMRGRRAYGHVRTIDSRRVFAGRPRHRATRGV